MRTRGHSAEQADIRLRDLPPKVLWPLWLALGAVVYREIVYFHSVHQIGADAHAYWLATRHSDLYVAGPMEQNAYLYSPAFRQLIWPLGQLPWPCFFAIWTTAVVLAFAWLLRPLGWAWGVPAFLLCGLEIIGGNIMAFLATALVIGMRRPEVWAFPILTKVTVGLGPLWFAAVGRWRDVARCAVATAVIVGISLAIDAHQWSEWIRFLVRHRGADSYVPYRFVGAAILVVIAARRRQPWLLAPAMVVASPIVFGIGRYLTLLAAIPRLRAMTPAPHPQKPTSTA